jgi:hypothetical protein
VVAIAPPLGITGLTARDYSTHGNHATYRNGELGDWTMAGFPINGYTLNLDGTNEDLSIPAAPSIDNLSPLSVMWWMRGNPGVYWRFMSKGSALDMYKASGSGRRVLFVRDLDPGGLQSWAEDGYVPLSTTEWWHGALTWNGGADADADVKWYKNGEQAAYYSVGIDGGGTLADDSGSDLLIGSEGSTYFAGLIGTFLIYNRVLTPSEIRQNYVDPLSFVRPVRDTAATATAAERVYPTTYQLHPNASGGVTWKIKPA